MLTIEQTGQYAAQIIYADPWYETPEQLLAAIETTTGHLDGDSRRAVCDFAEKMLWRRVKMERLCRATGCPEGELVVRWLIDHGLLVKLDDGNHCLRGWGPRAT